MTMIYAETGDWSIQVFAWQNFLLGQGFKPGKADAKFGSQTEQATKDFQNKVGLEANGIVEDNTLAAAKKLNFKPQTEDDFDFSTVTDFSVRVPTPRHTNKPGLSFCPTDIMLDIIGHPGALDPECATPTNEKLKALLVKKKVDPLGTVEGLRPAVEALERVLARVKEKLPVLFGQLGTEGMLCCRLIRGSNHSISNHAWGTAIDFTVKKVLEELGSSKVQLGTWAMAPFFNDEKFFWGAGFSRHDSMHFEASEELIDEWDQDGII
jgi:hypothetical protein